MCLSNNIYISNHYRNLGNDDIFSGCKVFLLKQCIAANLGEHPINQEGFHGLRWDIFDLLLNSTFYLHV